LLLLLFGIGLGFLVFSLVDDKQSSIAFVQECFPVTVSPPVIVGDAPSIISGACTFEEVYSKLNYFSDGATPYEKQNFYIKAIITFQDGSKRTVYRQLSNFLSEVTYSFDNPPPWTLSSIPVDETEIVNDIQVELFILEGDIGNPPVDPER
jgi:hypothetical protein